MSQWNLFVLYNSYRFKKKKLGIVAQTYNPSYFQGIDQKDWGSRPAWAKSSRKSFSTNGWHSGTHLASQLSGEAQIGQRSRLAWEIKIWGHGSNGRGLASQAC
jgi:hypothetical protein